MRINIAKREIASQMKALCRIEATETERTELNNALEFYYNDRFRMEEFNELSWVLRKLFRNHHELYEFLDFTFEDGRVEQGNHREYNSFNVRLDSYKYFLQEYFGIDSYLGLDEETIEEFAEIIRERVTNLLNKYKEESREYNYTLDVPNNFEQTLSQEDAKEVFLNEAPKIITDKGVFALALHKTKEEGYEELAEKYNHKMKNAFDAQLQSKITTLKREIEKKEERMEEIRDEGVQRGIELMKEGWSYENGKLRKVIDLTPDYVRKNNNRYELKEEYKGNPFYVEEVLIDTESGNITARNHEHANISNANSVCHGDLGGSSIREKMEGIEETLNTLNFDSPHRLLDDFGYTLEEIVEDMDESNTVWSSR